MDKMLTEMKVFISSPSDVEDERDIATTVSKKVSGICKDPLGLLIDPVRWEDLAPMTASEETIQEVINEEIKKCHVFVLILNKRYGSCEHNEERSNTEQEIDIALKMWELNKKIKILSFFKSNPKNDDPGEQEQKLTDLKERLQNSGFLYYSYSDINDFRDMFTHKMYETAIKFQQSTYKKRSLSTFWQIGFTERYTQPRLAILYPPMTFSHVKPVNAEAYWFKRILPNVLYEDIKAVEKVEKTIRLLGFRDFRTYAATDAPSDINYMNRIWVCQARIGMGYDYLEKYKDRSQFQFVPPKRGGEAKLKWRYSLDSENYIEIRSPLSRYLQEQRKNMDVKGEWKREMGMVVAKDYAVLARFRSHEKTPPMRDGYLYDYFITGIRGLGTWGAAYFIDRCYQYFDGLSEMKDIQILLEVTYKEGRIFEVKVVSDQPEHYFEDQMKPKEIKNTIGQSVFY